MKKETLAYLAGFFDGEGSIGIAKHKSKSCQRGFTFELMVQISGISPLVISLFHEKFGGSFHPYKSRAVNKQKIWMWTLSSRKALIFLRQLYPYLKLKKRQAILAIQFQSLKKYGSKLREEDYRNQEKTRNKIIGLNSKKPRGREHYFQPELSRLHEPLIQEIPSLKVSEEG